MPDEHLVFDGHALADEGVALDLAAGADFHALLDLDEGADRRLVADLAAVQVDEGVEADVPAQLDVGSNALCEGVALGGRKRHRQGTPSAGAPATRTTAPACSIERWAPSRIRTTRQPARPSTTSSALPLIASITFSASTASASRVSRCGGWKPPERHAIIHWYSFLGFGAGDVHAPQRAPREALAVEAENVIDAINGKAELVV